MKLRLVALLSFVTCASVLGAEFVTYEQFGAVGDGETDDFAAIVKAHAEANAKGLPVRAADGKTYYIGGADLTAEIATDTDFGSAKFMIDDTKVARVKASVFRVIPKSVPVALPELKSLARDAKHLGMSLAAPSLVEIVDDKVKRYIRKGRNQNAGEPQQEVLLVAADGTIDISTPLLWDYPDITKITAYPVDAKPLVVKGGVFVTIANQAESKYNYYSRGIEVNRSNVTLDGISHEITGEGDHGAPYRGFVSVIRAANVTVKDCVFTAHRTYNTIGTAKNPVPMGSYDLHANSSVNVRILNSKQMTDITDRKCWGLFASNYCKGLLFDGCSFSRFDAHMGVANATIRNSTLGHMGINAIGFGTFLVENTMVIADSFFNLRNDYGSTWDGEFIVRNSRLKSKGNVVLVSGRNDEQHDFGYPCRMPRKITFDGFEIQDGQAQGKLNPALFSDVNPSYKENARGPFPYAVTEEVVLKDVRVESGRELVVSANPLPFAKIRGIGSVKTGAEGQTLRASSVKPAGIVRGALCMSFDDRNFSNWKKALPLFEKYGAHATFCIMGEIDAGARDFILLAKAKGHSIAIHTLHHKSLERKNTEEAVEAWYHEEIKPQVDALAQLGVAVTTVAYPNNRRDATADKVLGKYFRHVRAGAYPIPNKALADSDFMFHTLEAAKNSVLMSGTGIGTSKSYTSDPEEFAAALQRCAERNEIFCTYSHAIQPEAKGMNCSTELLEKILVEAQRLGVAVVGYDELP